MKTNILIIIMFLFLITIFQCTKKNPTVPTNKSSAQYTINNNPALIIVIENNNYLGGSMIETGFNLYKDQILEILADIFNIDVSDMNNMTLTEIVDVYGEDWQINEIINIAKPYYQKIISLTDQNATSQNFLDSLKFLSNKEYNIDMIFNLHGNENSIRFADRLYNIDELVQSIQNSNISIRSLYQTCCFGSETIDEWESISTIAINGAKAENSLAIFSPVLFIDYWTSGMTFNQAVQVTYQTEIDTISSYKTVLPIIEYIFTDEIKENSRQITGGLDSTLLWINYPI